MEAEEQIILARAAAREASYLVAQYGLAGSSDALRIYSAAFVFMLDRIYGHDEAVQAIQQISRHLSSSKHKGIKLVIDNLKKQVGVA